jgi:hypothetical protein
MKIDNIKRKRLRIWKTSEKRTKQKCKTKWKANPADQHKQKTESRTQR